MTPETNPLPAAPVSPKPRPPWTPIVATILCALVLGLGSCFGFLNTLRFNVNGGTSPTNTAFMIMFLLCAVVFLGGVIWAFVRLITNSSRR